MFSTYWALWFLLPESTTCPLTSVSLVAVSSRTILVYPAWVPHTWLGPHQLGLCLWFGGEASPRVFNPWPLPLLCCRYQTLRSVAQPEMAKSAGHAGTRCAQWNRYIQNMHPDLFYFRYSALKLWHQPSLLNSILRSGIDQVCYLMAKSLKVFNSWLLTQLKQ